MIDPFLWFDLNSLAEASPFHVRSEIVARAIHWYYTSTNTLRRI